jgi:hypothetical protein
MSDGVDLATKTSKSIISAGLCVDVDDKTCVSYQYINIRNDDMTLLSGIKTY